MSGRKPCAVPHSSRTLHARFVRQLLPVLTLAFVLAALGTAWVNLRHQRSDAENQRQQTLQVFGTALAKPLWECDSATATSIAQAMLLQPQVRSVTVEDQCAQSLIQTGAATRAPSSDLLHAPLHYVDEAGARHPVGELRIGFAPVSFIDSAFETLALQLVIFIAMLQAVITSAAWALERIIGQPLHLLRQAMRSHRTLEPVPAHWAAEITEVAQTYNTQVNELQRLAHYDALTGLANRTLFDSHLQRCLRRVQRRENALHVLVLDLDDFKPINDRHGHQAGDLVLQTIAARLQAMVRPTDMVARLGGDEFVIVLSGGETDPALDAHALLQRLQHSIAQPIAHRHGQLQVHASVGLATYPHDGNTAQALLAHADQAMYAAKGGATPRAGIPRQDAAWTRQQVGNR